MDILPVPLRPVIGLFEYVLIQGQLAKAKIDTGATTSSIDATLAKKLHLTPLSQQKLVTSSHGKTLRPCVIAEVKIGGKTLDALFTIIDRSDLRHPILIGKNILKQGFLIDPAKRLKR